MVRSFTQVVAVQLVLWSHAGTVPPGAPPPKRWRPKPPAGGSWSALRRLVGARLGIDEALALEGSGWEADLDRMRDDRPPDTA